MLQLPEQPLKMFALEQFTKLQLMIKNQSTIGKDDREILYNIDVTYEEWGAFLIILFHFHLPFLFLLFKGARGIRFIKMPIEGVNKFLLITLKVRRVKYLI